MGEYMMAATAGMKMIGGLLGAGQHADAGNAAMQFANFNAAMYERQATVARERAAIAAKRTRLEGKQILSRIVQTVGSSGVSANEGSALDVLGAHAAESEWRALTEEWKGEVEAGSLLHQAAVARLQGAMSARGAYGRATASAIGGLAGGAFDLATAYGDRIGEWFSGLGGSSGVVEGIAAGSSFDAIASLPFPEIP